MNKKRGIWKLIITICMAIILVGMGSRLEIRGYTKVWTKDMFDISEIKAGDYSQEVVYGVTQYQGLERGDYTITIFYDVDAVGSYVDMFSYWQKQDIYIEYEPYYMEVGAKEGKLHFTLKENVDDVSFRFWYSGNGNLSLNGIVLERDGGFTDYYYGVLAVYFCLFFMFFQLKKLVKEERFYYIVIWVSIGIVSIPLLKEGIAYGWDLYFHVDRVEGIYQALRGGSFPVRVQASQFGGYGYAASIFYPDLFLYIPAFFRLLGMSLSAANELFVFIIQIAVGWVMYYSVKGIFRDTKIAALSAVFYIFSTYRVFNTYANYALGANIAAIFFPLVIWGLYELLLGNKKSWKILVIGCTGVFQSHIISTMFVAIFGGIVILLTTPKIIKEKRIMPFLKAGITTIILNLWFLVPFLDFQQYGLISDLKVENMVGVDIKRFLGIDRICRYLGINEPSVLLDYRFNVILVVWIGIFITVCFCLKSHKKTSSFIKGAAFVMLIAIVFIGEWFPWDKVSGNTWIGYLQFPVRLCMIIEVLASMIAAYGFSKIKYDYRCVFVLASCWCVISYADIVDDYFEAESFIVAGETTTTYLPQEEYIFPDTNKDALVAGKIVANNISYYDYSKIGTTVKMHVSNVTECAQILEVPLLYYPGYVAELNGIRLPVSNGQNNVVSICVSPNSSGNLKIWYRGFSIWYIANMISLIGWIGFCSYIFYQYRKGKESDGLSRLESLI